ncbi:hypothetical protein [Marinomonas sp.]
MNIETVSYLKANANNLSLEDPQAYYEQQETIALLKLINLSERNLNQKGEQSLDETFDV